jgi:16S rRNA (guanine966-N2)-methyltransferase
VNTVRIIAGKLRGKKLSFPSIPGLRPTPNRIKETLFNWLMHDIREANCLDAFAGSGSLGLEAYSRGANKVVFIEKDVKVYQYLKKFFNTLTAPSLVLYNKNTLNYLTESKEIFDIIFFDPPFAENYWPELIELLNSNICLKQGGLLYIESSHEIILDDKHWKQIKQNRAGQVIYALYQKLF